MATPQELIKGWLQYAKARNIKAGNFEGRPAEDADLKDFLVTTGIDETVVDNIIGDLGLTEPEPEPEEKSLTDQEVRYLNQAKQAIRKLSSRQKTQLYRELKSD